ncbi:hypothetical protein ACJMK2_004230 [Sinanodonta woodiana]|uniref:Uncharacterized protein n=1 Tax=Sinanodonta woodiana TaxID=1069815 RepID=A0ABD3Y2B1_SINWO
MRNHAVVLLLVSLFAVTLSRDLHRRDANSEVDGALLEIFARALEEGKLDSNDQFQEARRNIMRRFWLSGPFGGLPWGGR